MNARRLRLLMVVVLGMLAGTIALPSTALAADVYAPISGAGSTWAQNAMDQWRFNVNQLGLSVNYQGSGSADGRNQFRNETADFAVSELPYQPGEQTPARQYGYVPVIAGSLAITMNLKVNGQQLKNLRLSGKTLVKIFTGQVTSWDDPLIRADNSGLLLPAVPIRPVVRSDSSATTYRLTSFFASRYPEDWAPCNGGSAVATQSFPLNCGGGVGSMTSQAGSLGVTGRVSQPDANGMITYAERSYVLNTQLPAVDLRNAAGYYVGPGGSGPAIALTKATVADDGIADLSGAVSNPDPRSYPLSFYSYALIPTGVNSGSFTSAKRQTLAAFLSYSVCEGSQQSDVLGYSALPLNLVHKTFDGLAAMKVADPTLDLTDLDLAHCDNPLFDKDDLSADVLGDTAPMPAACQKAGAGPCGTSSTSLQHLSGDPVLSGVAKIGGTVHVDKGQWMNAGTFRYRWFSGTRLLASTGTPTYRVPAAAGGTRLGVTLVVTSYSGQETMILKSNTLAIPLGTQRITALGISGRPVVGRKLTAVVTCSPGAVRHYQWYAAGRPIAGATRATWILRPAQRGKRITVRLSLTRAGYITVSRTSARTGVVRAS